VQSEAVEQLVVVQQIFPYAVDDQMQKLVLFMQHEGHGKIANLFFRVLGSRDEVDSFQMAEIDVPSQDVNIE
jgi:hypothetical protein